MPYAQQLRNLGDADDLALFEELLTQPDPLLMDWFMRRDIPDNPHFTVLISEILRFSGTSGSAELKQSRPRLWAQNSIVLLFWVCSWIVLGKMKAPTFPAICRTPNNQFGNQDEISQFE